MSVFSVYRRISSHYTMFAVLDKELRILSIVVDYCSVLSFHRLDMICVTSLVI